MIDPSEIVAGIVTQKALAWLKSSSHENREIELLRGILAAVGPKEKQNINLAMALQPYPYEYPIQEDWYGKSHLCIFFRDSTPMQFDIEGIGFYQKTVGPGWVQCDIHGRLSTTDAQSHPVIISYRNDAIGSNAFGMVPLGPTGTWNLAWHDEFDDSPGMSGPTRGLAASKWNCGWFSGPTSPGSGNVTAITDPVNTSLEVAYHGPAAIVFPGDSACHLRLEAGVDNGGTFNTRTIEGGFITTAGLMNINPGETPVATSGPDLRPYTFNGPCVLEIRMRVPGPNASAGAYWPGVNLFNSGNYFTTGSPTGANWPGGQNYLEEIDLVEMFNGGSLGSSSAFNFHGASSYTASGIPSSLQSVDLSLAYHTYTYLFAQKSLQAWVDGILTDVAPASNLVSPQWTDPQYLVFQMSAKAGPVIPTTATGSPSDFMIDYVRVWQAGGVL